MTFVRVLLVLFFLHCTLRVNALRKAKITTYTYFDIETTKNVSSSTSSTITTEIIEPASGRIIFGLFGDIVPKTVENFRALSTGEKGLSSSSEVPLHYVGSTFTYAIKDAFIQGGNYDGYGGESIYGGYFEDENFFIRFQTPGLLAMSNVGANTNNAQFIITLAPLPSLQGRCVVFGRVVRGLSIVRAINDHVVVDAVDESDVEASRAAAMTGHRFTVTAKIVGAGELDSDFNVIDRTNTNKSEPEPVQGDASSAKTEL